MTTPTEQALLSGVAGGRRAGVTNAIALASQRTGVDFTYLLGQAQVESGMNASARAGTSSATGLYQFIDQSWLNVVKNHGTDHGLGWASQAISQSASGRYQVSDPEVRRAILNLRNDPTASSLMAAAHAADNKQELETTLGREATGTDLYMAHFLGLGGAKKFLTAMDDSPGTSAAAMFPAAARANRNVFYDAGGVPRSLADVYRRFGDKLDRGAAAVGATGSASGMMAALANDPNVDVVLGNEADQGDRAWVSSTLAQLNGAGMTMNRESLMRPNPANARLAYLMLAQMGGL